MKSNAIVARDNTPCLTAWGLHHYNYSRTDWKRRVEKETSMWLENIPIKLGLAFEAELGEAYFEHT